MNNIKSNREKEIDNIINSLGTDEEFREKHIKKVDNLFTLYQEKLKDYKYVINLDSYNKIKVGGYIRYINFDNELKWGGILIKKYHNNNKHILVLQNTNFKRYSITFEYNYIFYKEHKTQSDNLRNIFLSYLDKKVE